MISVPFELEWVEFRMLIPVIHLPEKSKKMQSKVCTSFALLTH